VEGGLKEIPFTISNPGRDVWRLKRRVLSDTGEETM